MTTLNKSDFKQDTRYTLTIRDENKKLRPANLYVMRLHDDGMVVRMTDKDGRLTKISYDDVIKIVSKEEVKAQAKYYIPDAVLAESNWKGRTVLDHYSSAPNMGK